MSKKKKKKVLVGFLLLLHFSGIRKTSIYQYVIKHNIIMFFKGKATRSFTIKFL